MTIRNKFSLIGIAALLIAFAVIFFSRQNNLDKKVFLHAEAIQTPYGWGYNIIANEKVYIRQEFIPGLPGKKGFRNAEDALKTGNLVVKKISNNQQPAITEGDLKELGVTW